MSERTGITELLKAIERIANCGAVEDYTVAGIRAELRNALFAYNFPEELEVCQRCRKTHLEHGWIRNRHRCPDDKGNFERSGGDAGRAEIERTTSNPGR